jgi:hypothetical protein
LAKLFQRRIFFSEIDQPETRIAYAICLLENQDKKSNLYRGHTIDFGSIGQAVAEEKFKM